MSFIIPGITFLILFVAAIAYYLLKPKAGAHRFFYAALGFLLIEIILYMLAVRYFAEPLRTYLDIRHSEFNHSSTFSSLLLSISAATAYSIFAQRRSIWESLYFLLLGFCFTFVALDEFFMIHETLPNWSETYAAVALTMAGLGAWLFWQTKPQDGWPIYLALFGGMALSASGSIGVERVYVDSCFGLLDPINCAEVPLLEEFLETLGFIFASSALLALRPKSPKSQFAIGAFAGVWLMMLLFSVWLQPALEAQFLGQRLSLQFEETPVSMTGYRLNAETFRAGESFSLDLYWQSSRALEEVYGYSVNLLDPVTGESLWRANLAISYPATQGWFPGITYRSHYNFIVPDSIETPVSAILTIALWSREGQDFRNFQGISETLPRFAQEFPIVGRVSFLSPESEFNHAYRFENGILLAEPELIHETDEEYSLKLSWSSEAHIDAEWGYFIHVLGQDGQENLIFDRPPFGNRFTSNFWLLGMKEEDELILNIPAEANGDYTVQMGLFDGANRLAVSDVAGNPIADNSIVLGTISIP